MSASITVLIATRNRANSLAKTLESLLSSSNLEQSSWEVIVADNGSSDNTEQVVQRFAESRTNVHHLLEIRKGKSHALNAGIAAARGELIAMMDDDVICSPNYISGIRKTFEAGSVDAAQGRTFLACEGGEPAYLHHDLAMFMGLRDFGDKPSDLEVNLCGTNSVVRASVFRTVGSYAVELGAGAVGFAEDSEMSQRIRSHGFRMIYAPDIVVTHQLPHDRITQGSFRKRYFGLGRSNALRETLQVPLWYFGMFVAKQACIQLPLSFWQRITGRPAEALRSQCRFLEWAGLLVGHWQRWHRGSRTLQVSEPRR